MTGKYTDSELRVYDKLDDTRKKLVDILHNKKINIKACYLSNVTNIKDILNDNIIGYYNNYFDGIAKKFLDYEKNFSYKFTIRFIKDRGIFDRFMLCFDKTISVSNGSYIDWNNILRLHIDDIDISDIKDDDDCIGKNGYKLYIPELKLNLFVGKGE